MKSRMLPFILLSLLGVWAHAASRLSPIHPQVVMHTSQGAIRIELDAAKAPITVANFLSYVDSKFYEGLIFHRVIPNFMIQGGGHFRDLTEKPTQAPIQNEATNGLSNLRGTIAMARTEEIHSATAQFFINVVDNDFLDHQGPDRYGYAVFGKVIEGMDVVDQIRLVPTTAVPPYEDVPVEPITILRIERIPARL